LPLASTVSTVVVSGASAESSARRALTMFKTVVVVSVAALSGNADNDAVVPPPSAFTGAGGMEKLPADAVLGANVSEAQGAAPGWLINLGGLQPSKLPPVQSRSD